MDNNFLLEVIDNYFNLLFTQGTTSIKIQRKLLVLNYLYELLCDIFVTEEDYNTISRYLEVIYGDCLIPYPDYISFKNTNPIESRLKFRSSQKGILRTDTNKNLRVALD